MKKTIEDYERMVDEIFKLHPLARGYLECLLWVKEDQEFDLEAQDIINIWKDCNSFIEKCSDYLINCDLENAGHHFYLTRNGHGTGFWDRPDLYPQKEQRDFLTNIAHSFGESEEGF